MIGSRCQTALTLAGRRDVGPWPPALGGADPPVRASPARISPERTLPTRISPHGHDREDRRPDSRVIGRGLMCRVWMTGGA